MCDSSTPWTLEYYYDSSTALTHDWTYESAFWMVPCLMLHYLYRKTILALGAGTSWLRSPYFTTYVYYVLIDDEFGHTFSIGSESNTHFMVPCLCT